MTEPFWHDDRLTVYVGDCRAVMAAMPAESVHCVVTSPPYWGLRDYGTAEWTPNLDDERIGREFIARHWDKSTAELRAELEAEAAECDHKTATAHQKQGATSQRAGRSNVDEQRNENFRGTCAKCGAVRVDGQLGLETTPEAFVEAMVETFREVKRVLRPDGTVWLNLGDSYASSSTYNTSQTMATENGWKQDGSHRPNVTASMAGLKPKDLVGIPWRVAFALQADGWYLRSDIVWSKPNPMPESVVDRPTKSHEYLFLLSKSPRYYYDTEAIREPMKEVSLKRLSQPNVFDQPGGPKDPQDGNRSHRKAVNNQAERLVKHEKWKTRFEGWDEYDKSLGRNVRTVWTIATEPYPGAHFATFPRKLVEPCIKAGTSEYGVCPECGAPWERLEAIEARTPTGARNGVAPELMSHGVRTADPTGRGGNTLASGERITLGWAPLCKHEREPVPATVLDPFAGSGTTGLVAQSLGRSAVLIDLSADYMAQIMERNAQIPLL